MKGKVVLQGGVDSKEKPRADGVTMRTIVTWMGPTANQDRPMRIGSKGVWLNKRRGYHPKVRHESQGGTSGYLRIYGTQKQALLLERLMQVSTADFSNVLTGFWRFTPRSRGSRRV